MSINKASVKLRIYCKSLFLFITF